MTTQRWILAAAGVLALGYVWLSGGFVGLGSNRTADVPAAAETAVAGSGTTGVPPTSADSSASPAAARTDGLATAIFASGCFWCTESDFDKVPGVVSTTSGYTGGRDTTPSYEEVSSGTTGHTEAVLVTYDPKVVSYETLLDHYWHNVDPFVSHRQFCDVGSQYRPAIFVRDAAQRAAAEQSKAALQQRFKEPILVEITDETAFYPAENYHQDYYQRNSAQYRFYRYGCGRDRRLEAIWGEAH